MKERKYRRAAMLSQKKKPMNVQNDQKIQSWHSSLSVSRRTPVLWDQKSEIGTDYRRLTSNCCVLHTIRPKLTLVENFGAQILVSFCSPSLHTSSARA